MLFRIRNLTRKYRHRSGSDIFALNNISLDIDCGQFVSISGPSGSGKSTLLFTLGGLLRPTSGSIHFADIPLHEADDKTLSDFRKRNIGYVMQNFFLVPYLTAEENVMVAIALSEKSVVKQREIARELLDSVGLSDRRQHLPREMSAGQQQRVAIARSLANNPTVILADEPTGNLDPALSTEILSLLGTLNADQGLTIIMVTHSPEAAKYGTTQIQLMDGETSCYPEGRAQKVAGVHQ